MRKLFIVFHDKDGHELDGGSSYNLHIPVNMDALLECIRVPGGNLSALAESQQEDPEFVSDRSLQKNTDGSVDLFFGPRTSTNRSRNWVETTAGRPWLVYICFYLPEEASFNKFWEVSSIEKIK